MHKIKKWRKEISKMIRVLQVVSCLELGGTEAFIMNNYRAIDRKKVQFDFLVFTKKDYPYIQEIEKLGGRIFFCGKPQIKSINLFLKKVERVIKENGPYNAIHAHINIINAWVLYAAKKAGIPIRVSHSHATGVGRKGFFRKLYYRFQLFLLKKNLTHCLACSEEAGKYLYGKKYFDKYGEVIHNGIDLIPFLTRNDLKICALREEWEVNNQLVIGNITRFDTIKNQSFIISVFSEIKKKNNNAILILGGIDGGELQNIKQKVKELQLSDSVRFIGERKDVPDCLQIIEIYIFPSLREGLGIALLEAQASGCLCFPSTGVPKEADMEIGTVQFLSLKEKPEIWAEEILNGYQNKTSPTIEHIKKCFEEKGYNIEKSSRELIKIYAGEQ